MKTSKPITLALAATMALGASALADQTQTERDLVQKRAQQTEQSPKMSAKEMASRMVNTPVELAKRTGRTLSNTPKIVSETFRGERPLISKNGILAERQTKQPSHRAASTAKRSEKKPASQSRE